MEEKNCSISINEIASFIWKCQRVCDVSNIEDYYEERWENMFFSITREPQTALTRIVSKKLTCSKNFGKSIDDLVKKISNLSKRSPSADYNAKYSTIPLSNPFEIKQFLQQGKQLIVHLGDGHEVLTLKFYVLNEDCYMDLESLGRYDLNERIDMYKLKLTIYDDVISLINFI